MFDNQIIQTIIAVLGAGLAARGYTGVTGFGIKQGFQPTNQGVPTKPTIFLFKIGDHRLGWTEKTDKWDQVNEVMVHTERQWYETTFQINGLAMQDPSNVNGLTASDIVNIAAGVMQSDATLQALKEAQIGILRITDVRNPYFTDDKDRFEADPSFDFTLEHEQVIITTSPTVEAIEFNINRV